MLKTKLNDNLCTFPPGYIVELSFWPTLTLPCYESHYLCGWSWEHSADMPLLSSVHISFYENSFKCKLDSNNINNQALFCCWIQKVTLKSLPMCLQYNTCRWFSNKFYACMPVCECVGVHIVHLSIYMSERLFPQCSGWSTRERFDTFKSLYYKQLL